MFVCYGAQADQGWSVHSQRDLTLLRVLSHKSSIEIHWNFIYLLLQALNVQKNPMAFLSLYPRETKRLKGFYTSAKNMFQKW